MDMRQEIIMLRSLLEELSSKFIKHEREMALLVAENLSLRDQLSKNHIEINELKEQLRLLNHQKNSKNSSTPPSQDRNEPTRNISLREKSGKKPGGQPGHKGTNLKMVAHPDQVINHYPQQCSGCGHMLPSTQGIVISRRQVIDIPPIKSFTTEHQLMRITCRCGHCTDGSYPPQIKNSVSYGANIEAWIGYMSARQYMPVKRIQEMLSQLLNVDISTGTIISKIESLAHKCLPFYNEIRNDIQNSPVIGVDETGCKVNGKNTWFWALQNESSNYILHSTNRSRTTLDDHFPCGFAQSTLVHDCWTSYFKLDVRNHQLCIAHILRELNYFIEERKSKWPYQVKMILQKSLKLRRSITDESKYLYLKRVDQLILKAKDIISKTVDKKRYKLHSLWKRLNQKFDYLFTFLIQLNVPPDNNGSERAIRNVKVKQKISGQFKNKEFAEYFAVLRSVIDTCVKRDTPVWQTLANL